MQGRLPVENDEVVVLDVTLHRVARLQLQVGSGTSVAQVNAGAVLLQEQAIIRLRSGQVANSGKGPNACCTAAKHRLPG